MRTDDTVLLTMMEGREAIGEDSTFEGGAAILKLS